MVPKSRRENASQRRIRVALTRIEVSQSAARHNRLVGRVREGGNAKRWNVMRVDMSSGGNVKQGWRCRMCERGSVPQIAPVI